MKYKVFISSTIPDLKDYRSGLTDLIRKLELDPIVMEDFPSEDATAVEVCKKRVEAADIFIGVYAHRYGYIPPKGRDADGKRSITELEYDWAKEKGIPRLCFLIDPVHPWQIHNIEGEPGQSLLSEFKKRVDTERVRLYFTTPEDLKIKVITAIFLERMKTIPRDIEGGDKRNLTIVISDINQLEEQCRQLAEWKEFHDILQIVRLNLDTFRTIAKDPHATALLLPTWTGLKFSILEGMLLHFAEHCAHYVGDSFDRHTRKGDKWAGKTADLIGSIDMALVGQSSDSISTIVDERLRSMQSTMDEYVFVANGTIQKLISQITSTYARVKNDLDMINKSEKFALLNWNLIHEMLSTIDMLQAKISGLFELHDAFEYFRRNFLPVHSDVMTRKTTIEYISSQWRPLRSSNMVSRLLEQVNNDDGSFERVQEGLPQQDWRELRSTCENIDLQLKKKVLDEKAFEDLRQLIEKQYWQIDKSIKINIPRLVETSHDLQREARI